MDGDLCLDAANLALSSTTKLFTSFSKFALSRFGVWLSISTAAVAGVPLVGELFPVLLALLEFAELGVRALPNLSAAVALLWQFNIR